MSKPGSDAAGDDDPTWLKTAFGERGVKETPGDGVTPRIIEYFAATWQRGKHADDSGRQNAWCAAFVTWCLAANGIANKAAVGASSYETWGEITGSFRGAVVVLERGGHKHVAYLAGVDRLLRHVYLGGNQADRVSLATFPYHQIVAVRKPTGYVIPAHLKSLPLIDAQTGGSTT